MKKLILLMIFISTMGLGFAQITLEQEYDYSGTYTKLANSGYKFYVMDDWVNQCRIYNIDHSHWKTINLLIPPGQYLYDIKFVSEGLFTTDEALSLLYIYYEYDEANEYYTYTASVITENTDAMLTIPGAAIVYAYDLEEGGTKMVAYTYDYSAFPYFQNTLVYNLPGNLLSTAPQQNVFDTSMGNPFPNPARDYTKLPYSLPQGESEGVITLTDLNGKTVKSFTVDNYFNHLKIQTGQFPKGTYLYYLTTNNYKSETKKLVIE